MSKANIPKVKEWIVRCEAPHYAPDVHPAKYRVLAPTRLLAILNLRDAGIFDPVRSATVARKPVGTDVIVAYLSEGSR